MVDGSLFAGFIVGFVVGVVVMYKLFISKK